MGLMDDIRDDIYNITTDDNDYAITVTLTAPDEDSTTAEVKAVTIKHNNTINPNTGLSINAETSRIMISTATLEAAEYPYRNDKGKVMMIGHTVVYTDSYQELTYMVKENWVNDMLGMVTLILGYKKT